MIPDGHKHEPAGCMTGSCGTNVTSNSASTHFLPGFRFVLKAKLFPLQEIELSLCTAAALRGLRLFRSCWLFGGFGLGLRVSRTARFLALYIHFVEVVFHHSTMSTHKHTDHLLYHFLLFSTTTPSLMTCPSRHWIWHYQQPQKNMMSWERKGEKRWVRVKPSIYLAAQIFSNHTHMTTF